MDGTPVEHIGARIRYWRRRRGGMSQAALAGLAGLSQPYVSQIESGRRSVERRSTLVALASALQVSVADLLGQPGDPTDPMRDGAAAAVPGIRVALIEIEEGERHKPARSRDEVTAALDQVMGMRWRRADYAGMTDHLPDLLRDAAALDPVLLARVGYETSDCLRNLGYVDLARPAARIAVAAAAEAEDPAWTGAARFIATLAVPAEASATAARVADRVIGDLQAHAADARVRQVLGQVHLSAAFAATVANRSDDAAAHLAAAGEEARTLDDPVGGIGFNAMSFGHTNIDLWRIAIALEQGEPGRAAEVAARTKLATLRCVTRHYRYWLDYGRALAHSGRTDAQALAAFMRAERAAPVPFSVNPLARDAVLTMVNRAKRRAVPDDLRLIASRLGIDANGRRRP